jgi:hypothetical protein
MDAKTLAAGCADGRVHLIEPSTGKVLAVLQTTHKPISGVRFTPSGIVLAQFSSDQNIVVWDLATGKEAAIVAPAGASGTIALSADGGLLAMPMQDMTIRICKLPSGHQFQRIRGIDAPATRMAFSNDGKLLAAALGHTGVKTFCIWETATGQKITHSTLVDELSHDAWIACAFAPNSERLAVSTDRGVYLWDLRANRFVCRAAIPTTSFTSLEFLHGGESIVMNSDAGAVLVWQTPEQLRVTSTRVAVLSSKELTGLWEDLGNSRVRRAYCALWKLQAAPQLSVPFLRRQLHSNPHPEPARIPQLIKDLNNDRYFVRKKATEELQLLLEVAEPALRLVLASNPPLEVHHRVEELLRLHENHEFGPGWLRATRALQVLEHAGTREAIEALREFTQGPDEWLQPQAQASLDRLTSQAASIR